MKNFILIISLAANVAAIWWLFPFLGERIGGHRYHLSKPDDLTTLRRLIYQCDPLLHELKKHHQANAKYPDKLTEVEFSQSHYMQEVIDAYPLSYGVNDDGQSFDLFLKLGWDPGLRYQSTLRQWRYDPGDGTEGFLIQP